MISIFMIFNANFILIFICQKYACKRAELISKMIKNHPVSIIKTLSKSKLIRYKSDSYRVDITSTPILEGIIYLSTLVQIIYLFSLTRNAGCYVPFFIAPVEGWKALWAPYTGTSGPITLGDIWAPSGSPWPSLMSKNFKNNIFQQL